MEAIRKQASKLREQVAKQQQAILKQLGHIGSENLIVDESELQCHEQLQKLYDSTRAAKHFQRNIVRGVEGFATISSKQMEIVRKLAEDCCKYGSENQNSGSALACLSLHFGASHNLVEREGENFLRILRSQICEPLRASVGGAPLEDARHLTHRYDRIRQEVEAQAAEVAKRRSKCKESEASSESSLKLQNAEAKLKELKSKMMTLGREATAAMSSVEVQQQRLTFQRLISMVNSERSFHQSAAAILEKLHVEMILQVQRSKSELESASVMRDLDFSRVQTEVISDGSGDLEPYVQKDSYFVAQVIHPFDAQADGELSLSVGDYVVVHQVTPNGWCEGECNGKSGWFPSAYMERREEAPTSKSTEDSSP